jgi:hypothetical protein
MNRQKEKSETEMERKEIVLELEIIEKDKKPLG